MRSMSIVSSSSPLDREENFLKGRLPSPLLGEEATGGETIEEVVWVAACMRDKTVARGLTGDTITRGLGGERSKFSLRGAQLTGTLKLKYNKLSSQNMHTTDKIKS